MSSLINLSALQEHVCLHPYSKTAFLKSCYTAEHRWQTLWTHPAALSSWANVMFNVNCHSCCMFNVPQAIHRKNIFLNIDLLFLPTETMTTATSPILLKWDPKSLEIRTLTVERLLEPLVTQVLQSTLNQTLYFLIVLKISLQSLTFYNVWWCQWRWTNKYKTLV